MSFPVDIWIVVKEDWLDITKTRGSGERVFDVYRKACVLNVSKSMTALLRFFNASLRPIRRSVSDSVGSSKLEGA